MWYAFLAIIFVAGVAFSCKNKIKNNNFFAKQISMQSPQDTVKILFTKKEILNQLEMIAKTPPPENLSFGAMCYEIAMPPDTANYVCPICGEKTLYKKGGEIGTTTILQTIPNCRGLIRQIHGVNLKLDESSFCKNCNNTGAAPELCLLVNIKDENDTVRSCKVDEGDLNLLKEFFEGKLVHKGFTDNETPLKEYLARIEELLGVKD